MNMFDKRPLFSVLTASILAFVVFTYSDKLTKGILISSMVFLLVLSLFLDHRGALKRKLFIVIEACALATMLLSLLYFNLYFDFSRKYGNEEVEIYGTVQEITDYTSSTSYTVKVTKINGKSILPRNIKIYVYKYQNYFLEPGNIIKFSATFCEFDDYGDFDSKAYYYGKGISADTENVHSIVTLDEGTLPLNVWFYNIRQTITERAIAQSDENAASLLSALLLGERNLLSDELKLNFKRLGITHILALSGLHLSILSFGIQKLLSFISVKKKARLAITSVIILLYMAITGFSSSVVRAGIMLIIYSALFLLGQTKDSLTSLAIAVTIILIAAPYSVYDISLWLSALSTLGIVATSGIMPSAPKGNIIKRILLYIASGLFISFAATSATLTITAYSFGATSLLAAPATMIFSILSEAVIYVGTIMLIFGNIIPIGHLLILISDLSYYLARVMSAPDIIYIKINYPIIKVLIVIYTVIFIAFLIINFKNKLRASIAVFTVFAMILTSATVINVYNDKRDMLIYSSETGADIMLFHTGSQTSVIVHGNYTKSLAYDTVSLLEEHGINSIDDYYLTSYSSRVYENVKKTMSLIKVRCIYAPTPKNDDDCSDASELEYLVEGTETKLILYDRSTTTDVGELKISPIYINDNKICILSIQSKFGKLAYISSGALVENTKIIALKQMTDADAVIFGCYGKKYSDITYLKVFYPKIKMIVLGSNNLEVQNAFLNKYIENGTKTYEDNLIVIEN